MCVIKKPRVNHEEIEEHSNERLIKLYKHFIKHPPKKQLKSKPGAAGEHWTEQQQAQWHSG
jgi:hypothetical protein